MHGQAWLGRRRNESAIGAAFDGAGSESFFFLFFLFFSFSPAGVLL